MINWKLYHSGTFASFFDIFKQPKETNHLSLLPVFSYGNISRFDGISKVKLEEDLLDGVKERQNWCSSNSLSTSYLSTSTLQAINAMSYNAVTVGAVNSTTYFLSWNEVLKIKFKRKVFLSFLFFVTWKSFMSQSLTDILVEKF